MYLGLLESKNNSKVFCNVRAQFRFSWPINWNFNFFSNYSKKCQNNFCFIFYMLNIIIKHYLIFMTVFRVQLLLVLEKVVGSRQLSKKNTYESLKFRFIWKTSELMQTKKNKLLKTNITKWFQLYLHTVIDSTLLCCE